MSAAGLATVLGASALHRGSPWVGVNASVARVVGGSLRAAGVHRLLLTQGVSKSAIVRRELVPALLHTLGPRGTYSKYAAMGTAAALGR